MAIAEIGVKINISSEDRDIFIRSKLNTAYRRQKLGDQYPSYERAVLTLVGWFATPITKRPVLSELRRQLRGEGLSVGRIHTAEKIAQSFYGRWVEEKIERERAAHSNILGRLGGTNPHKALGDGFHGGHRGGLGYSE